jgi:DNA repair photolyase
MITDNVQTPVQNATSKTEITVQTRILNPQSEFKEKLLCDGPTFSPGSACLFTCSYCYTETMMNRGGSEVNEALKEHNKSFQDVVIRRADSLIRLQEDLRALSSEMRAEELVAYTSPAVDVAAKMEMAEETIELCKEILQQTKWSIRILSKSNLILYIAAAIPVKWKHRIVLGLSTGTLDDRIAQAIEPDAPLPSKRIEALRQLQQDGYRTFAMLCPILPQDPVAYVEQVAALINLEACEHVWSEVLNRRGKSMQRTQEALRGAGLIDCAERLERIFGGGSTPLWEAYARSMFAALTAVLPANKLRFLQYVTDDSLGYWLAQQNFGAILLGQAKARYDHPATAVVSSVPVKSAVAGSEPEAALKAKRRAAAKKAWVTIRARRAERASGTSQV